MQSHSSSWSSCLSPSSFSLNLILLFFWCHPPPSISSRIYARSLLRPIQQLLDYHPTFTPATFCSRLYISPQSKRVLACVGWTWVWMFWMFWFRIGVSFSFGPSIEVRNLISGGNQPRSDRRHSMCSLCCTILSHICPRYLNLL